MEENEFEQEEIKIEKMVEEIPSKPFGYFVKKEVKNFLSEHSLSEDALNRCNFDMAFIYFGGSQQSKGRALELVDAAYRDNQITADESNKIVKKIHSLNDDKIRKLLQNIKTCSLK